MTNANFGYQMKMAIDLTVEMLLTEKILYLRPRSKIYKVFDPDGLYVAVTRSGVA